MLIVEFKFAAHQLEDNWINRRGRFLEWQLALAHIVNKQFVDSTGIFQRS